MSLTSRCSQNDWSLHRKGPIDQARHNEKVKEAIKENLAEHRQRGGDHHRPTASKIVKVPIRSLELPQFRFDHGKQQARRPGQRRLQVGDVIGQDGQAAGPGRGKRAGRRPRHRLLRGRDHAWTSWRR